MTTRRAVTWAVFATAASAAVALTIPALAGTSGGAAGEPTPDTFAALKRDLQLSDEQATTRLRKERWAAQTQTTLRRDLGEEFGGAWLNRDASRLMVGVTDDDAAAAVRKAGATPHRVTRSEQDLNSLKRRLDDRSRRADRSVAGWYVDVAGNGVVVVAQARRAAERFVRASGIANGAVRVVVADERPVPLFDVRGGDPFFLGQGRCSVGFSVEGGFVTAGHCGRVGSATRGFNRQDQGTFRASSFPGDDFGVVAVNEQWTPRAVVDSSTGADLPVSGSREAPVGSSVCRSGSTTGTHCGVIQATNATVNYPQGTVTGLTRTNVCAEPGDSGGPFVSDDQAQGVTSGGSGNCASGGVTFFQPINEILERNQLTLVTTAAEDCEPPGPTAGPSDQPTPGPTDQPTPAPTDQPTPGPSDQPTPGPTESSTGYRTYTDPSAAPTAGPSDQPTPAPTDQPTPAPTDQPTPGPTDQPTPGPTDQPTGPPPASPTGPPCDTPAPPAPSAAPTDPPPPTPSEPCETPGPTPPGQQPTGGPQPTPSEGSPPGGPSDPTPTGGPSYPAPTGGPGNPST